MKCLVVSTIKYRADNNFCSKVARTRVFRCWKYAIVLYNNKTFNVNIKDTFTMHINNDLFSYLFVHFLIVYNSKKKVHKYILKI